MLSHLKQTFKDGYDPDKHVYFLQGEAGNTMKRVKNAKSRHLRKTVADDKDKNHCVLPSGNSNGPWRIAVRQ